MEFTFKLKYQLTSDDSNHDELIERLGEAGCDDALIGIGQPGRVALEFTREAESAFAALISALADVKRAVPAAKLIEVGPDLVGLTDVADFVGVTRQNIRKLAVTNSTSFPTPVHEGSSSLWHLADVLGWLMKKGTYKLAPGTIEIAKTAKQLNIARQVLHLEQNISDELRMLIA
ncbi:AlpA family transcriptional regulator [Duganella sp. Root1480D1]|uniref:helix-turn-helix transcriptional regulator n=1 Tax=Duganella sp. Root1480D1 TaxID=1736471 RepID=UPI00070E30F0|nr:hypothetical protein [Duganella sp. Root1480D1]KQZ26901.1 DNA-binding protein [Duganella sp. Root1480D1]